MPKWTGLLDLRYALLYSAFGTENVTPFVNDTPSILSEKNVCNIFFIQKNQEVNLERYTCSTCYTLFSICLPHPPVEMSSTSGDIPARAGGALGCLTAMADADVAIGLRTLRYQAAWCVRCPAEWQRASLKPPGTLGIFEGYGVGNPRESVSEKVPSLVNW